MTKPITKVVIPGIDGNTSINTVVAGPKVFKIVIPGLGGAGALFYMGTDRADELQRRSKAYNQSDERPNADYQKLNSLEEDLALIDVGTIVAAGVGIAGTAIGAVLFTIGEDPNRYEAKTSAGPGEQPPTTIPGLPTFGLLIMPTGLSLVGAF